MNEYDVWLYDLEVFKHNNLGVFKLLNTDKWFIFHNDNVSLKNFIDTHPNILLCGFNNRGYGYDDWILSSIYYGADNLSVKAHNDWIIKERKEGWKFPFLNYKKRRFNSMDLRQDLPKDLSLKEIEGNLLMNIEECEIDFDIDRPLTDDELKMVIEYCKHDVLATEMLYNARLNYINAKKVIAKIGEINEQFALGKTNAQLTATLMEAEKVPRSIEDVRNYVIPDCIRLERIPKEVLDFFAQLKNHNISMEHMFDTNKKDNINTLKIKLGNCPCVVALGGIHGSNGNENINNSEKLILNYDVASLYPSSIINFGYYSRNSAKRLIYKDIRDMRVKSKADEGKSLIEQFNLPQDSDVAGGLKLPLNTYYGAVGQALSDLYDPLMAKSVCITNQLAMIDLIVGLLEKCESIFFNNINTDGIMFMIDEEEKPLVLEVIEEWENRTGFELEEDNIKRYISKDVNNYFMEFTNGKIKAKGGYIGRYKGGNFEKNSMIIIQKAIVEFLANGITPDITINECTDIFQFQTISKMGSTYSKCFHEVNGEKINIQKVNRVYATKDKSYGSIKKLKIVDGKERYDSVANLPEHCIIDNSNRLTINDIDKDWYINLTIDRIVDFVCGVTTRKKMNYDEKLNIIYGGNEMATKTTEMNIYMKLANARLDFIKRNVKKTGKNGHLKFMYYTLDDIVPPATEILAKYGLIAIFNVHENHESKSVVATVTDGTNNITFIIPFEMPSVIRNKEGNEVNNKIQDLGSALTYTRRYMWLQILDITEHDSIDGDEVEEPTKPATKKTTVEKVTKPKTKKAPLNEQEKKEKAKEVIQGDGLIDVSTFNAIKRGLGALQKEDNKHIPYIQLIIDELNSHIDENKKSNLSMTRANEIMSEINDKLEGK